MRPYNFTCCFIWVQMLYLALRLLRTKSDEVVLIGPKERETRKGGKSLYSYQMGGARSTHVYKIN
jgi:hypothetical protein